MKRLSTENKNTPEEYKRIFFKRINQAPNILDVKRWRLLVKRFRGGRFLDIGCLDSFVCALAQEKRPKAEIWGIDIVPEVISFLQAQNPSVHYLAINVYKTNFPSNYFNYAVAGELLEHLERPKEALEEIFRILKIGGVLALSVPLEESEKGEVDREHHLWSFTKDDIAEMIKPYRIIAEKILRSQWLPYRYNFPVYLAWILKK